jgi:hypothetical protein
MHRNVAYSWQDNTCRLLKPIASEPTAPEPRQMEKVHVFRVSLSLHIPHTLAAWKWSIILCCAYSMVNAKKWETRRAFGWTMYLHQACTES